MTSPLTAFLLALDSTDVARLCNADPAKLAAKYGIRLADAAGYLKDRMGAAV